MRPTPGVNSPCVRLPYFLLPLFTRVRGREILRSSKSLASSGSYFRPLFEGSVHLFEPS
jgi:hypothetical protein